MIFGDAWWFLMVWWCLIAWCFVSQLWKRRKSKSLPVMSATQKKNFTWLMSSAMLPCHHPGIDKCVNWRHLKNILRYPASFFQYIGSFSFQICFSSHQILTPHAGRKMLKKSSHQLSDLETVIWMWPLFGLLYCRSVVEILMFFLGCGTGNLKKLPEKQAFFQQKVVVSCWFHGTHPSWCFWYSGGQSTCFVPQLTGI